MLKGALSLVGALVLLLGGSIAGAMVEFTDRDQLATDSIAGMPTDCADYARVAKLMQFIVSGGKTGLKGYACKDVGTQNQYYVNLSHIGASINKVPGGYRTDGVLSKSSSCPWTGAAVCSELAITTDNETFVGMWSPGALYANSPDERTVSLYKDYQSFPLTVASAEFVRRLESVNDFYKGYTAAPPPFYANSFNAAFLEVISTGAQHSLPAGFELPPDPAPGDGTGGTGGAGGTTTSPACTKGDGTTSGNPYDCAPTDSDTKCSFIDIPCNLKYLFIPRKEFLSEKLRDGVGLTVKFPLTVADSWMTTVTFADHTFPVGADFSTLTWNEETKDQFRFFAWWSTFLFLLGYLGVPFMGGKRGMADSAKDSTVGAAAREAAENDRAEAAYRSLRADDSWKNP